MSRYKPASLFRITKKWRCPDCGALVRTAECIACWVRRTKGYKKQNVHTAERDVRDIWDRTHSRSTPKRWLLRRDSDQRQGGSRRPDF